MQTLGILITKKYGKIKVLVRQRKYGCSFKIRKSGGDGDYFNIADSQFLDSLEEGDDRVERLLRGEVIKM